jgi:hypothetical protein
MRREASTLLERSTPRATTVAHPHHALGYRPPFLEAIRGRSAGTGRAATCANESIPSPHHRARAPPAERSTRCPSHHLPPGSSLSLHSEVGPERCLVDLRPMSLKQHRAAGAFGLGVLVVRHRCAGLGRSGPGCRASSSLMDASVGGWRSSLPVTAEASSAAGTALWDLGPTRSGQGAGRLRSPWAVRSRMKQVRPRSNTRSRVKHVPWGPSQASVE